ncbi:MAG: hypothetical protein AB8F94_07630 [Saprospiraceae bacterium]
MNNIRISFFFILFSVLSTWSFSQTKSDSDERIIFYKFQEEKNYAAQLAKSKKKNFSPRGREKREKLINDRWKHQEEGILNDTSKITTVYYFGKPEKIQFEVNNKIILLDSLVFQKKLHDGGCELVDFCQFEKLERKNEIVEIKITWLERNFSEILKLDLSYSTIEIVGFLDLVLKEYKDVGKDKDGLFLIEKNEIECPDEILVFHRIWWTDYYSWSRP